MIVDTSALLAVLQDEPPAAAIVDALIAGEPRMSAPTLVEARIVTHARFGATGVRRLESLLRQVDVEIVDFDEQHADAAADAYRDFGKGSGHPASLNLGDTFSYATAFVGAQPLLYVGNDFVRTDIRSVLPRREG